MTDLDRMIETFNYTGIKYKISTNYKGSIARGISLKLKSREDMIVVTTLILDGGEGYTGLECLFHFNADGQFLGHACFGLYYGVTW